MAINPITPISQLTPNYSIIQAMQAWRNAQQTGLQNQTLQAGLPFVGPQAAAQVALTQAQAPLTQAQTGLTQAETQFFPITAAGKYYAGLGTLARASLMNSPQQLLSKYIADPTFQSTVQNNPGLAKLVGNIMSNSLVGAGGFVPPGMPNTLNTAGTPTPAANSMQNQSGFNLGMPGFSNNNVDMSGLLTPSDYNKIGDTAGSQVVAKTVPKAIQQQRYYSGTLDAMLDKATPLMQSASLYSGPLGRIKLANDASKATMGINTPDYTNYRNFTDTLAPQLANEFRRVLGGQATDAEMKTMKELADKNYWHSNPDLAMNQFNYIKDLYQKTIGPTLQNTPNEVSTRSAANTMTNTPDYSWVDPQTAQKEIARRAAMKKGAK